MESLFLAFQYIDPKYTFAENQRKEAKDEIADMKADAPFLPEYDYAEPKKSWWTIIALLIVGAVQV